MSVDVLAGPRVRSYEADHVDAWDNLVARSCNGTFMHTRRFLSYHGDRFQDLSVLLEDRRGNISAVFPAALSPVQPGVIVSHPGLTYAGLVHDGSVQGMSMIAALWGITNHYRDLGYERLRYKAAPNIYHSRPSEDDLYALFRLGACHYRCDLSAAIDLSKRGHVKRMRLGNRRRAQTAGVSTHESWREIAEFWRVLKDNLARRYGAAPVHSFREIQWLREQFPDEILLITANISEVVVGGAVLFSTGPVLRMQYKATTEQGRDACASDLVIEHAIELARDRGYRYLDFGTCTLDEGRELHEGLYWHKVSFGAGGVVYDHYDIDLRHHAAEPYEMAPSDLKDFIKPRVPAQASWH